ncbi:MAG: cation diffusion facilitator CzcD-associated flavoprotein CzcO [Gammaproteobacteria bacterium]|jgi:cation diffusion facilitator CzcD-associated flavoprotein CzcO
MESKDVVVVGAGFAGLYLLHRLRGLGLSAVALEAGTGVGGTWYWNRYPGARCDVESMQYSYSFSEELEQEWSWSERFAGQPEILRYANHVADRFELREFIRFNTRVASAHFDEIASRWTVTTDDDAQLSASHVVMATGCLSSAKTPDFPGLADFKGETYHTGQWPHESVDLCGKRVGIIGTGSSAIQAIPVLAEQAGHLTVFQRTPNYSIPSRNGPMTPEYEDSWKCDYPNFRARARMAPTGNLIERNEASAVDVAAPERERIYEQRWAAGGTQFMGSFSDLATNQASNDTAAQFVRQKIREMVKDGATAELLAPKDYPIGTKRICVDTHYFETFNRPNVTLVDVRHQEVETLTQKGVVTGGQEYEFDAIVFATGFDAMTGTLFSIDIQGRQGEKLKDKWEAGPRTYLGLMSNGFPNMFLITGPGSPSVLSNMMVSIEQHVDYVSDVLAHMQRESIATIEPQRAAEDAWVVHVNEVAYTTLYPKAASWYMGANIPGKPRLFLPYIGGVGSYRKRCDEVADAGYEGFDLVAVADIGSTAYTPHRTSA